MFAFPCSIQVGTFTTQDTFIHGKNTQDTLTHGKNTQDTLTHGKNDIFIILC